MTNGGITSDNKFYALYEALHIQEPCVLWHLFLMYHLLSIDKSLEQFWNTSVINRHQNMF